MLLDALGGFGDDVLCRVEFGGLGDSIRLSGILGDALAEDAGSKLAIRPNRASLALGFQVQAVHPRLLIVVAGSHDSGDLCFGHLHGSGLLAVLESLTQTVATYLWVASPFGVTGACSHARIRRTGD